MGTAAISIEVAIGILVEYSPTFGIGDGGFVEVARGLVSGKRGLRKARDLALGIGVVDFCL